MPLKLYGKTKVLDTYAFLDEGSSLTMLEDEIADQLELTGTPESLCLKWTADTVRVEPKSKRVSLKLSAAASNGQRYKIKDVFACSKCFDNKFVAIYCKIVYNLDF